MAEKTIKNCRIITKHGTEEFWHNDDNKTFVPMNAEQIIYDPDASHPHPRMKIGDGQTPIIDLPFYGNATNLQVSETKPTFACTWFNVTRVE